MNKLSNDDRFAAAFDRQGDDELKNFLRHQLQDHGHGAVTESAAARQERERVEALIEREKKDRVREADRKAAELEVAKGLTVNIGEAVIEPTPEWLEKGSFNTFTPKLENGTVRTVMAYRRAKTPMILKFWNSGRMTDDQALACMWYRDQFEAAGLVGRYKSSHISLTGNTGGGGGGAGQAPLALHAREAEARDSFRHAAAAIAPVLLKMFDAVVLHDIPLRRAAKFVRCRNGQEFQRFLAACQDLVAHVEANNIEVKEAPGETEV